MISLLTQKYTGFFCLFFFMFCLQSPFTTKTFKTKSPKLKGTRFSFYHSEGNMKKMKLYCFPIVSYCQRERDLDI